MFKEAYDLLLEILHDKALDEFIFNETGKHLAIIDSGAQVTIPAAKISFSGSDISNPDNAMQYTHYNVEFMLPFWGDDAFSKCHDFLDIAVRTFFSYQSSDVTVRNNRVMRLTPTINEENEESELWTVAFDVTVSIFY